MFHRSPNSNWKIWKIWIVQIIIQCEPQVFWWTEAPNTSTQYFEKEVQHTSSILYTSTHFEFYIPRPGFHSQFRKMSTSAINSRGVSYDYDSVMHYHSTAFGNGRITITRKDGSTKLGNTRGLSAKDVQQANLMYCNGQPVTSKPPTGIAALFSCFCFFFFPLAMFLTWKCSRFHKAAKFGISGTL